MTASSLRAAIVAGVAVLLLFAATTSRVEAPANFGAHELTSGFGRGRLDVPGIVSDGSGAVIHLPRESMSIALSLSGSGPVRVQGEGVDSSAVLNESSSTLRIVHPRGGDLAIESSARVRLASIAIERTTRSATEIIVVIVCGALAVFLARRDAMAAGVASAALIMLSAFAFGGGLSTVFLRITLARALPLMIVLALAAPFVFVLSRASWPAAAQRSGWPLTAFVASLTITAIQLALFEQPIPMGDPAAYLEMGGKYADAIRGMSSPLDIGAALLSIQPYLALPATGLLYGFLRLLSDGLNLIYVAQAVAMAIAVQGLVSICATEINDRVARIALVLALLHPSFAILPGIVQPEPFILAAWTGAALMALRAMRSGASPSTFLGVGLLLGIGLGLHPQGLSFLLIAIVICVIPWVATMNAHRPAVLATVCGGASVLIPLAVAQSYAKPAAYVLDRQYGFFAYTSAHPLGFWLYTDSDGWQGPLRVDDTTYQKELIALRGEGATSSTYADVAAFAARHPAVSIRTVLTNLHRLWNQPDNPFAVSFALPYSVQIPFHRAVVVLFVLSLARLLSGRLALLALPFVILSMTYPGYHIFNKYATPALPFLVIGAATAIEGLVSEGRRGLAACLSFAAFGALFPANLAARAGMDGDFFLIWVRGALWLGLAAALWLAIRAWAVDARARVLTGLIGSFILLFSSMSAATGDTTRSTWSASLEQPAVVMCRVPTPAVAADPAWLLIDVESLHATPPRVEINGRGTAPAIPTMPSFGLATFRGRRNPATLRQMWRVPVTEEALASAEMKIRISGDASLSLFGDLRPGNEGPRLSIGLWPDLSVYRLMHEGQYRLPTFDAPPQACDLEGRSGRPGLALVRVRAGDENVMTTRLGATPRWIF